MKNFNGHQGENERAVKKMRQEHVRHFFHKTLCIQAESFWKFHVVVVQNNAKEMYKKVCCTCKIFG